MNSGAETSRKRSKHERRVAKRAIVMYTLCLKTTACDVDVYNIYYESTEPLKVIGVCKMRGMVRETGKSTDAMFVIIPDRYVTLYLGRITSEVIGALKLKFRQYPAIHTNYSSSNGTILN